MGFTSVSELHTTSYPTNISEFVPSRDLDHDLNGNTLLSLVVCCYRLLAFLILYGNPDRLTDHTLHGRLTLIDDISLSIDKSNEFYWQGAPRHTLRFSGVSGRCVVRIYIFTLSNPALDELQHCTYRWPNDVKFPRVVGLYNNYVKRNIATLPEKLYIGGSLYSTVLLWLYI